MNKVRIVSFELRGNATLRVARLATTHAVWMGYTYSLVPLAMSISCHVSFVLLCGSEAVSGPENVT
ncbi:hypothetical protein LZ32DRAFT_691103 [Colletotrichum eremochloae]|nr:hypothetical protein LZ32DRAFT_691103 [Colletotrichum eremochloae]